jgi:hypothetical protein
MGTSKLLFAYKECVTSRSEWQLLVFRTGRGEVHSQDLTDLAQTG